MRNYKKYLCALAVVSLVTQTALGSVVAAEAMPVEKSETVSDENNMPVGEDITAAEEIPEEGDNTGDEENPEDGDNTGDEENPEDGDNTGDEENPENGDNTGDEENPEDGDNTDDEETACEHLNTKIIEGVEPTCEEDGVSEGEVCLDCGEYIIEPEILEAFGHDEDGFEEGYEPTCEEPGLTDKVYCSECGEVFEEAEEIEALGHSYDEFITKADASKKKNGKSYDKCSECGKIDNVETIYYPKTVTVSKKTVYYTGKALKNTISVKDSKGKKISSDEYTVSYKNNKLPGKATVTVSFKNSELYTGSIKASFTIKLKTPSEVKITSANNVKTKSVQVKWKAVKGITGYELNYTVGKTSKTVKIGKSATSYKIKGLKLKKTYSIKMRTYTKVGKTVAASKWSKAVKVKVSK